MNEYDQDTLDLLRIIEQSKESVTVEQMIDDTIMRFIKAAQIKDGTKPVPNYVVYYYYAKVWCPEGRKVAKVEFFRQFAKMFRQKRYTHHMSYLIDSILDTSKPMVMKAKEHRARYEAAKQGIKNAKKKAKEGKDGQKKTKKP